ncbi:hypothetical protein AJ88_06245 [Mesorhizobium amorphae CCBAU 01583]|nr:hypothetical protein AJ88_06245 [Mesorhizobium amorphae CCBAU 01583]
MILRFERQRVDHVLDCAHPSRVVYTRFHRIRIEQPRLVIRVLGISTGTAAKEVEAETAPGLGRVEITEDVLALHLLALEELGHGLHLLPGLRHAPLRQACLVAAIGFPGCCQIRVGEHVGAVVEVVRVAVDGDAVLLAIPGADRRLQIGHNVLHVDLVLDPVRHFRGEALAADVASKGAPISMMSKSTVPVAIACCRRGL